MTRRGWFVDVPVSWNERGAVGPGGRHPNIGNLVAPPLFTAPTARGALDAGKARDTEKVATDEYKSTRAIPVLLMKCVFLWPDSQNVVTRFIATWLLPALVLEVCFVEFSYVVMGEYDTAIIAVTSIGDVLSNIVTLFKLLLLAREGPRLARIREQLQTDFSGLEHLAEPEASAANVRCAKRCHTFSRRVAYCFVPLCLSFMLLNIVNAFDSPEERRFAYNAPRAILRHPVLYWASLFATLVASGTFYLYTVGFDTLFLSLCMHVSCKCDILKIMLVRAGQRPVRRPNFADSATEVEPKRYDFEYWKDDGSALELGSSNGLRDDVEENLKTCVLYHNMIIQLHDDMESIFSGVFLWMMGYILLGLGIPGLRMLHEFRSVADAAYAALRHAEVGDSFNEWTTGRGRPQRPAVINTNQAAGITLRFLTMRAQKPLYLTAGKIANITLELYLDVIRKSQSIYSYLIRMR